MSNSKRYTFGLALALLSAAAAAELPQSSILTRYGVTSDQLPKPPATETAKPIEEKSRFQLQPEQPWVTLRLGDGKQPEKTGNISIDRSMQQEQERCQRMQEQLLRRGGQYISCDNSIPGTH
ncbi:hypothetical protein ACVK1X_003024 [Pseudomonas sp. PvR086]|uniref:hypothetical protein n=1 Tax=Pseudomonas TaxID=286 RepID=UPI00110F21B6|nr:MULTISPECIES: hypothetical protein [Pseudomonas]MBD9604413.1 hypothetical protein [Pseudomonas sp. PDM08]MBD9618123.1 hypothetical protein [Pseudomonas sp. PDM07]MDR7104781.1 hypothetical protein [Pseudomonas frederiksbergensis]QDV95745.1 hypothetical protein FFH90_016175 [Pseudomonas sp. ATCC 43928]CAH0175335.1 hypothetical protein SRABI130_01379 [Pseudomonas sp. Bi130]